MALGLADRKASAEVRPELQRIQQETKRLNELIHQLLLLSQLESQADVEAPELLDLRAVVEEIATDAAFEASNSGRRVRVIAPEACTVRGSATHLRSAVENVVRNALHHTAAETEVTITVDCAAAGGEARVRVRDQGPGVPEAALEKLFQPFYRVSESRDRQSGGAGLGLAIAEHAITAMGGGVRAWNAEGGGLVVEIRLTALPPPAAD